MMKSVAVVLHSLPGRVRLEVPEMVDRPDLARHFEKKLGSVRGISRARFSELTGRALIEFDERILSCEGILKRLTLKRRGPASQPDVSASSAGMARRLVLGWALDFAIENSLRLLLGLI